MIHWFNNWLIHLNHWFIVFNDWLIDFNHLFIVFNDWLIDINHWFIVFNYWLIDFNHWFIVINDLFVDLNHSFIVFHDWLIDNNHWFIVFNNVLIDINHWFIVFNMWRNYGHARAINRGLRLHNQTNMAVSRRDFVWTKTKKNILTSLRFNNCTMLHLFRVHYSANSKLPYKIRYCKI